MPRALPRRILAYTPLEAAYAADTRDAEGNALRQLVADARDGHGRVADNLRREQIRALPIQLGVVEARVVVTASRVPSDAPVGAVVSAINGTPAAERVAAAMRLRSGTSQWREAIAVQEIVTCPQDTIVKVVATVDRDRAGRSCLVVRDNRLPKSGRNPSPN